MVLMHDILTALKNKSPSARRTVLDKSQLLAGLEAADLDAVLSRAVVRRAARNAVVVRRGDPTAGLIIIVSGRVRIGVTSETGKELTLAVLGPGEMLGEMSLLDGEERCADATAAEDCELLTVEREQFLRLLRTNSSLCLRLAVALCRRLRSSNTALENMVSLDLPSRLAKVLLRLAEDYGTAGQRGVCIGLKLSQSDLGSLVGASREKVNRQLRKWEEDGLIHKDRGYLVISHPDALTMPL
jgi:CRP/FNR family transcriptional regulator, cyclic AMP receptor protein